MAAVVVILEIGMEQVYVSMLHNKLSLITEPTDFSNSESLYCPDASNKGLFQASIGFGRCRLMNFKVVAISGGSRGDSGGSFEPTPIYVFKYHMKMK